MVNHELPGGISQQESKERIFPVRLVVKFGTKNLCSAESGEERLDQKVFDDYARQIVELQQQGVEVVVVSSGAIQAGREEIGEQGILTKQDLAAVGQPLLMARWREAIQKANGRGVSQLLLTYTNWSNEQERVNIINRIFNAFRAGLTAVINENDSIAKQEISSWERRISENDRLAKMIADLVKAKAILFLTDEGGIYTGDPQKDPEARLLSEIPYRTAANEGEIAAIFGASEKGANQGMRIKWREASRCYSRGMNVAIAGQEEDVILRFVKGESVGTMIGTTVRIKERGI